MCRQRNRLHQFHDRQGPRQLLRRQLVLSPGERRMARQLEVQEQLLMRPLAVVNGGGIEVDEGLRRQVFNGGALLDDAVEETLLREYAAQQGIANSDQELRVAFDELRYRHGLLSVEATRQWLVATGQTIGSV